MIPTILRAGNVVTENGVMKLDVVIADGKIRALTEVGLVEDGEVIDVSDCYVIPGGVDVHTHMDSPSGLGHTTDTHQTGTRAAATGGTTTIVDFAPQGRGESLLGLQQRWLSKMENQCAIDYSFHATISSWYPNITEDMDQLVRDGISSFKVYMAYKGAVMIDDGQLFEVLRASAQQGSRICIHAENGDVIDAVSRELVAEGKRQPRNHKLARPAATEAEAVHRALMIAELTGSAPYFVHLSTKKAVEHVREAKARGIAVAAETCTHYLSLDESVYDSDSFDVAKYVLTPPIRSLEDQASLWQGLRDGDISVVSSDHCPLCLKGQKDLGANDFRDIPNGGPGVENRMMVTYSEGVARGRLSIEQFVQVVSTEPAKIFGMYPRKGVIQEGADADLVVLDPNGSTYVTADNQYQNVDYNLWEGWNLSGQIKLVYSRGALVSQEGNYVGTDGHGQFVPRARRT